jgi:hypothetical protein
MIKGMWKRISNLLGVHEERIHSRRDLLIDKSTTKSDEKLTGQEISFLGLLEGKRADDPSTMGWWCAFNKIDGPKLIKRLQTNGYLTSADYKFKVNKATLPMLKDFLREHGLRATGKKVDLVNRIIENISEADCSRYFKQSYWALTSKAADVLRAEEMRVEEEYKKNIELIRRGSYEEVKRRLYPSKKEHWGTEDTFVDTIDYIMDHGFEEFGLRDDRRRNVASFVAARAVDYSSRGYETCIGDISRYLSSLNMSLDSLKLPRSLLDYAKQNEIQEFDEIFDIYVGFAIDRARARAELSNYKRLGIKRVKIDSMGCRECGKSESGKTYTIGRAPVLPLTWNCGCMYSAVF